jgi:putative two-component system response regulator
MTDPDPRPSVLVVDDERGPRESLRMILEPSHRVLQAACGSDALEILRAQSVDVATLDLQMPGMRGDELMGALGREFPGVELIVITGCGSVASAAAAVRQGICEYLQKPFDVVQVTAAVARAIARRNGRPEARSDARAVGGAGAWGEPRTLAFLELLAGTIEANDRFMRGHARRVAFYSGLVAERMGLAEGERETLRMAAFLHDLGKVGVPTDLLRKPGPLAPDEKRIVEQHPVIGSGLLAPLDLPAAVSLALRHHHEWWNGRGYPDGIGAEGIPLPARIIGVADAFDAMTSDRPYRRTPGRDHAAAELRRWAGVQFDPEISKEFLLCLEAGLCDVDPQQLAHAVGGATPRAA